MNYYSFCQDGISYYLEDSQSFLILSIYIYCQCRRSLNKVCFCLEQIASTSSPISKNLYSGKRRWSDQLAKITCLTSGSHVGVIFLEKQSRRPWKSCEKKTQVDFRQWTESFIILLLYSPSRDIPEQVWKCSLPICTYGTFFLTISQHPHPPVERRTSACNKSVNVRKETSFQWRENKAKIYQQFHSFTLLVYRILFFQACIFCLPLLRESDVANNCHVFVTSWVFLLERGTRKQKKSRMSLKCETIRQKRGKERENFQQKAKEAFFGSLSLLLKSILNRKTKKENIGNYAKHATNLFPAVAPMVWVENQVEHAPAGAGISLSCTTESYPPAIHFW